MQNIRSGNLQVKKMKSEIEQDLIILQFGYLNTRTKRQLIDGKNFLEMISKAPYASYKTVGKLKKAISEERKALKERLAELDVYTVGHQFSFFEEATEVSEREKLEVKKEIDALKENIHWLHKCLGMCSNRDYFK